MPDQEALRRFAGLSRPLADDRGGGRTAQSWLIPISLRLRELRTAKGWTQQELAQRSGVPQYTISRLESGEPESVNLAHLEQLADALEVNAALLIVHEPGKGRRG